MNYYNDYANAHAILVDTVKQLLYNRHPDIFERLDFENDTTFEEPLLFKYLSQNDNKWLDCIIYGYEKNKKQVINVFSDKHGIIYLPATGYLHTNLPNRTITLETIQNKISLKFEEQEVAFSFEPLLVAGYGIEIVKHQHPLLESVFLSQGAHEILINDVYKAHLDCFNKALQLLNQHNTHFFDLIKKSVKKVMLFTSDKQNSFAALTAQNMIFLNVHEWDNELFFIDHISHEGSHVIFFTLTFKSKYELFNCPYDTPFSKVTGVDWEHSTVYLRFHGLFTYMGIIDSLLKCMNQADLPGNLLHELKGRFVFYMIKYKLSLETFENLHIFKEEGLKWFAMFKKRYYELEYLYEELKDVYKLATQPYDFNSKVFAEENALLLVKPIK